MARIQQDLKRVPAKLGTKDLHMFWLSGLELLAHSRKDGRAHKHTQTLSYYFRSSNNHQKQDNTSSSFSARYPISFTARNWDFQEMAVSHFWDNHHEKKTKTYFGQFSPKLHPFPVKMSLRTSQSGYGKCTFFCSADFQNNSEIFWWFIEFRWDPFKNRVICGNPEIAKTCQKS